MVRFSTKVLLFLAALAMGLFCEGFASNILYGAYVHRTGLPASEVYYRILVSLMWFFGGVCFLLMAKWVFWPPKEIETEA